MLSREYFPADTRLSVSTELREALRHYYDFLTAYENVLRDNVEIRPCAVQVSIANQETNPLAVPQTIWTISRSKNDWTMVHLINLLGSNDPHWRDVEMVRPRPPRLHNLSVRVALARPVHSISWASPDVDGGRLHPLRFTAHKENGMTVVQASVPSLDYWDTLFIESRARTKP